ncbi:MAG: DciA family protein [Pseudomonadota bacterium]
MNQRKQTYRKFTHVGTYLKKPISEGCSGRGFAQSRLLTQWPEIAGAAIAKIARPVNVSYPKTGLGAVLTLLTNGANAPLLQMQIPEILRRVNAVYGYRAIHEVRITQSSRHGLAETPANFDHKSPTKALSKESQEALDTLVSDVKDDNLKSALTALGKSLKQKPTLKRKN